MRAEHLHEFFAKPQYLSATGAPIVLAGGSNGSLSGSGPARSIFEMPWKQKEALLLMSKSVSEEASEGGALTRNRIKQGTFFERWQNFLTIIYSSWYHCEHTIDILNLQYFNGTISALYVLVLV